MLENNAYNLMAQLTEEHQSLWRIKNYYLKDAEHCDECKKFWEDLATEKEQKIQDLTRLVGKHLVD
jgi:hypothetical protein